MFIELTGYNDDAKFLVNLNLIASINNVVGITGVHGVLWTSDDSKYNVKETYEEIKQIIRDTMNNIRDDFGF